MTPISNSFQFNTYAYFQPVSRQSAQAGQAYSGSAKGTSSVPADAGQSGEVNNKSQLAGNKSILGSVDNGECKTCESRKYKDGSDDPGVSFKAATKLSPKEAASAVRSHENEHVVRNQAKAEREDRKVVSQSVTLHTDICPECGTPYISGGTTRTVTKADNPQQEDPSSKFQAGMQEEVKGRSFDMVA